MVNCSHPMDIDPALTEGEWVSRVHGVRANSSKQDHSMLNTLGGLDEGDPDELAEEYASLKTRFPDMNVFGGCCGTDDTHVRQISSALQPT